VSWRVRAVRFRPRRSHPQAARARPARHRADEAEAVRADDDRADGAVDLRRQRGLPRRRADEQDPRFEEALHTHFANTQAELNKRIVETGAWDKDIEAVFKQSVSDFKSTGTW
jgi:hypothetical protein